MNRMLCAIPLALLLLSCRKDPTGPDTPPTVVPVATGVYVLNEGNYGDPSGARLSLYDLTRDSVFFDVVESANAGAHLGSTGDDLKLYRGELFCLMSGSENLTVVGTSDHLIKRSAFFPGWVPHAMAIDTIRNRIYVTQLYRNAVGVLDLATLAPTDSFGVGANPQDMLISGSRLFICNSGYGSARGVSVYDLNSKTVTATITVGPGPTGIVAGPDGSVWVACTGDGFATPVVGGGVYRINPATLAVEDSVLFPAPLWGSIATNPDGYAYILGVTAGSFYGGPVHRFSLSTKTVSQNFIPGTFYSLAIDEVSGDVYLGDAKGFTAAGEMRVYTSGGTLKRSAAVQRGPAAFVFKR